MPQFDYEVEIIQKEDRDDVIQFMRDYFMEDEPINTSINLITKEKPVNVPLEEYLVQGYDNGISTKAVRNGKMIGVCINPILERNQEHEKVESDNKDFLTIYNFLVYMDEHSDAFKHFPGVNKAITVSLVAVDSRCRGKGIAKDLMSRALIAGKQLGCGFMVVECSSHYTALAMKRMGFECIYTLPYKNYKVDGKIVFNTDPPHTEATVYVKKL
ncbi:arylalkylamine N-acetyltransferase 1 [Diabrotica virgifera virgifera]|uniref:aralkylamine N-acetyltransferase n=1 Tax=Diabrotica virgifera virgifera TaxID=50390 RepID=A0A6P7F7X7_DIAVI|nr:arylalkylamine N-acetyltransferase 1 [Diabrotica virgifera virgifera]XP_028129561.1 arylalkylamine N-acetyltransferase 1 [Diabrotica virgifera virgifera]XP_050515588.1 arylalkylamine N-acetyltransferase 1 [Diabrotica virgifera virgifera]